MLTAKENNKRIKVLVVDDSPFMRKLITDILETDAEILVVGTAQNGEDALNKVIGLNPDVITLDIEMPFMNGLECLEKIKVISNARVIMISGITGIGTRHTILALEKGAFDFIIKPVNIFSIKEQEKSAEIIIKVKSAYETAQGNLQEVAYERQQQIVKQAVSFDYLVAIGTSTGGPRALHRIITSMPSDIPAAITIVQHMPAGFTHSLAERLNALGSLTVKEAENNEQLKPGYVYIAPGDYNMEIRGTSLSEARIILSRTPPINGHRPSVDYMFQSIAATGIKNVIAVVLTGMGKDGSEGIKALKDAGKGYIIAQDENTSIVYGMPKSAYLTGRVDTVVPLEKISSVILKELGVQQTWT